jgi:hypothetical protein
MSTLRRLLLAAFCAVLAVPAALSAQTPPIELRLGNAGTLLVEAPAGMERTQPTRGSLAALEFATHAEGRAMLLLTPIPRADAFIADEELRKTVEAGIASVRDSAVEREFPLTALRGEQARGYYYLATDRAPKPGEFRYLTQGAVAVGGVIVTFTILHNKGAEAIAQAALESVRRLRLRPTRGA